ncbi:DNA-methyltransferase [Leptospira abararensis]|uniref:DNA-methyltransferase n=1 Tax=Leptospira abararensis TaxID=2810036 RepID=UPI001E42B1F6|nr:site-specific DNA-methyltransferase [Leptospira abararensis]
MLSIIGIALYLVETIFLYSIMLSKLYNGDCLKILPTIEKNSIDVILCDLPYGTTDCKWDKIIPMESLWSEYHRITKPNSPILLFSSQPFTTYLINSNPKQFRYEIIWYKTKASGFLNARKMPNKSHENIVVFYKNLPYYNPVKYEIDPRYQRKGKQVGSNKTTLFNIRGERSENYQYLDDGSRFPDSVLCFPSESRPGQHPTEKPNSLLRFLLKSYAKPGFTILDNCMGKGNTGIACAELGLNFIGIEQDKSYFKDAETRIRLAHQRIKLGLSLWTE